MHTDKASITQLSRVFDLSRSALHEARSRASEPAAPLPYSSQAMQLFDASGATYGSRRLSRALQAQGCPVGRQRARRLMRQHQLRACWGKSYRPNTTDSGHGLPVAHNVLDRQFDPPAPNHAWGCDITYIPTDMGWLYLAVVIELYSRKVLGWASSTHMPAQLVVDALHMAICTRQPPAGLIVHSDRGSQYASHLHQALLADHGLTPSMSRRGNCWDNAVTERFFLNLKMERVWRKRYANAQEAQRDITDYIVNFYNSQRLHSSLGYCSPNDFERQHHHFDQQTLPST